MLLFVSLLTLKTFFRTYSSAGACTRVLRRRQSNIGSFVGGGGVRMVAMRRFRGSAVARYRSKCPIRCPNGGRCITFSGNVCVRVIRHCKAPHTTSRPCPGLRTTLPFRANGLVLAHFGRISVLAKRPASISGISGRCCPPVGGCPANFHCAVSKADVCKRFVRRPKLSSRCC